MKIIKIIFGMLIFFAMAIALAVGLTQIGAL